MYVRSVSERILVNPGYGTNFICDLHKRLDEKPAARTVVITFLNKEQSYTNDSLEKKQIADF